MGGESVSDSAVRAPRVPGRIPIPFLIKCGWAFMALWAVTMYVTAAFVLVGATIDAIVNGLPPTRVTKDDILLGSGFILFAAVSGPFAWGVWKERPWTRETAMAFWVGMVLIAVAQAILKPIPSLEDVREILWTLIGAATAAWYFYRQQDVVLYYKELAARERGA